MTKGPDNAGAMTIMIGNNKEIRAELRILLKMVIRHYSTWQDRLGVR